MQLGNQNRHLRPAWSTTGFHPTQNENCCIICIIDIWCRLYVYLTSLSLSLSFWLSLSLLIRLYTSCLLLYVLTVYIYINIRLFYTCLNFMCLPKNKVEQNPDPKLQLDPLPLRVRDHDQPLVEGIFGYAVPPNGRNVHGRVHVGGVPADFPRSPLGRNRTKGGIFEALSFDDLRGDVS